MLHIISRVASLQQGFGGLSIGRVKTESVQGHKASMGQQIITKSLRTSCCKAKKRPITVGYFPIKHCPQAWLRSQRLICSAGFRYPSPDGRTAVFQTVWTKLDAPTNCSPDVCPHAARCLVRDQATPLSLWLHESCNSHIERHTIRNPSFEYSRPPTETKCLVILRSLNGCQEVFRVSRGFSCAFNAFNNKPFKYQLLYKDNWVHNWDRR